jgi:hypothetical protein
VSQRLCMLIALVLACDKSGAQETAALAIPSATATAAVPSTVPPRQPAAWLGSYKSTAGSLYIPSDWKDVKWKVKESGDGIGEGPITLQLDPKTHGVEGALDGPLGPAAIHGIARDGALTATVVRKDPGDKGFAGTLIGTVAGDHAEGTMNLSLGEASAIRTATFALSPQGPASRP